ncbi:MAG: hypothetical protein IJQ16_06570 [Selenomonadaceae bacterium]|nr:hypothetical protein [Selenomonadaceae bacterium]
MLKKISVMVMLTFALIFAGAMDQPAEAARVYVGTYRDNGAAAYLLTESFRGNRSDFSCTVVTNYGETVYYNFYYRNGSPYYSNSWGARAYVYGGDSPVAVGVWEYYN